MKRSRVLGLRETVPFKPLDNDPLELAIVPAGLADLVHNFGDTWSPLLIDRVARDGFKDFHGYFGDDGQEVENSLEARKELLELGFIRLALKSKAMELHGAVASGESSAASV